MKTITILFICFVITITLKAQNVGIGTTAPGTKLTIQNTGFGWEHTNGTTSIKSYVSGGTAQVGTYSNSTFQLMANNGSNQFVLLPNGNVGIAIANPTERLTVLTATNSLGITHTDGTIKIGTYLGGAGAGGYVGTISNHPLYFMTNNGAAQMTVATNGNVGIGTTTPTSQLEIVDNSAGGALSVTENGAGLSGYFYANSNNALYAYNSSATVPVAYFAGTNALAAMGNTGIRTNSPAFPLDVVGRVRLRNDGATTPGIWFNKPDETQGNFIGQYDATNFGIWGPGAVGNWKFLFDGSDGTLRIGTTQKATGYLVNVGGKIIAEEVRVTLRANWPDYVFANNYSLKPLPELESFIKTNNHLPNIPAAVEVQKSGIAIGEMQTKMMEKIEELSLYIIQQNKSIELLKQQVETIKTKINQ